MPSEAHFRLPTAYSALLWKKLAHIIYTKRQTELTFGKRGPARLSFATFAAHQTRFIMSSNIKTIIFDLGGVLIDWNPEYVYRKVFDNDEQKMRWFLSEICPYSWNENQDAGKSWPLAIEEKVAEYPQYKEWIEAYYDRWEEMLGGALPQTVEILRSLKENTNYQLLALTNWSAETFPTAQKHFDFLGWFDGIVVSGAENTRKPFPEIYQVLFDRYSVTPSEAIFIDDNKKNVEAGQSFGLNCINFTKPELLKEQLTNFGVNL